MSETGFLRSVVWLSRFLTVYQSLFRSNLLASPHWYLQAIADVVVAVIDRLEKGSFYCFLYYHLFVPLKLRRHSTSFFGKGVWASWRLPKGEVT